MIFNNNDPCFVACGIENKIDEWQEITSDKTIIDIVKNGYSIEFKNNTPPEQGSVTYQPTYNAEQRLAIDKEILKLLQAKVIEIVSPQSDQFVSPIFTRPKSDGSVRLILNLKIFNEFVEYQHFKMDTFHLVLPSITKNCFMSSIDLRLAYFSIPVNVEHRKYLRFYWRNQLLQYTCLPNGLASAPRIFTKILKPVFASLRTMGYINAAYIDDSILVSDDYDHCKSNVKETLSLLQKLGFTINWEKSVLDPANILSFLGFVINSKAMQVTLPENKVRVLLNTCSKFLAKNQTTIKELASLVGTIISVLPAVKHGPLHYRVLEIEKNKALKKHFGNYNAKLAINVEMKMQIKWWKNNLRDSCKHINIGNPQITITTDASGSGWGAHLDQFDTAGIWSEMEYEYHSNNKELLAILYGLESLCKDIFDMHVLIRSDNTSAVAHVNHMGGIRSDLSDKIAQQIWHWAISHRIWLSAGYIAGSKNTRADKLSRNFSKSTEWMLNPAVFQALVKLWDIPDIDLFASRTNHQVKNYVSWFPDPYALNVDSFSVDWKYNLHYIFPPFSLMARCLQKIKLDGADALVIAPLWPTQIWFTPLMDMLTDQPRILPNSKTLLTLPGQTETHPMFPKLKLIACHLSGNRLKVSKFHQKLQTSSYSHGEFQHKNSIRFIFENGFRSVTKGKLIEFIHL